MQKNAIIFTEGKTDWMHLETALKHFSSKFSIQFYKEEKYSGEANLLKLCEAKSITPNTVPHIFIFDRDNDQIIKKVTENNLSFKNWKNRVYSFILPIPAHREHINDSLSIEFYYEDKDLLLKDVNGRRLYITSEFNSDTGKHNHSPEIHFGNRYKLKESATKNILKILDFDVFGADNKQIALSKNDFAKAIHNADPPFNNINFQYFKQITDLIEEILVLDNAKTEQGIKEEKKLFQRVEIDKERLLTDHPPVIHTFVGRKNYIKKIDDVELHVIALTGIGGEGKSTIAAKYFELANKRETKNKFVKFAWSDYKDIETPLHDKLLGILDKISDGLHAKEKYFDENFNETVYRFIEYLNQEEILIVFDNVDGFVEKDSSSFFGPLKILFDEAVNRLTKSLVIFTCRPAIEDVHITYLEIPLKGLSLSETNELANNFGIVGNKLDEKSLVNIYEQTSGHALWLNLIFAQIRSERLNVRNIDEIFSRQSDFLDATLLNSIWETLNKNEKEVIQIISIFKRPPDLDKIHKTSKSNFLKIRKIVTSLIRLKLVTEIEIEGEIHYDLHPIIRGKARESCVPEKRRTLQKYVIAVLSFGDWQKLKEIMNINDSYSSEIDNYVECAEIAIENKDFESAIDYIYHVSEPLRKYCEDSKFIELCKELFKVLDKNKFLIGVHTITSEIFSSFIYSLLEQGEYQLSDSYLNQLNDSIKTIAQYKYFAGIQSYNLWFQNHFQEAISFSELAVKKILEKGEQLPKDLLHTQALAKRDHGLVDEALKYFTQQTNFEAIENWDPETGEDISSDVGNISRCLFLKKQYKKSLEYCNKSIKFLQKSQSRRLKVNLGYGLLWQSDIYIKLKKFKDAEKSIQSAIQVWSKYCPSKLIKIKNHMNSYPKEFLRKHKIKFPV